MLVYDARGSFACPCYQGKYNAFQSRTTRSDRHDPPDSSIVSASQVHTKLGHMSGFKHHPTIDPCLGRIEKPGSHCGWQSRALNTTLEPWNPLWRSHLPMQLSRASEEIQLVIPGNLKGLPYFNPALILPRIIYRIPV